MRTALPILRQGKWHYLFNTFRRYATGITIYVHEHYHLCFDPVHLCFDRVHLCFWSGSSDWWREWRLYPGLALLSPGSSFNFWPCPGPPAQKLWILFWDFSHRNLFQPSWLSRCLKKHKSFQLTWCKGFKNYVHTRRSVKIFTSSHHAVRWIIIFKSHLVKPCLLKLFTCVKPVLQGNLWRHLAAKKYFS